MQFRILGPVETRTDGRPITVPLRKQRTLLAALLCNANDPVHPDVLVDLLWRGSPPPTARTNLRGYIHQLRRLLDEPGRIVRHQRGYSIRVGPEELDADRFQEAVDDAAGQPLHEAPRKVGAHLRRALSLWTGPALTDVDQAGFIQLEANRLEEMRLATLERRVEADLAAGDHAALIPELQLLAAKHPYREDLHAHLMVALYRSHRQAEALSHFQNVRRALDTELGVEPCQKLRRLETAILNNDQNLEGRVVATTTTGRSTPSRPVQLPPAPADLSGRSAEIERLRAAIRPGHRVIATIDGMYGVGKSALAISVASRNADQFADGVLYADLEPSLAKPAARDPVVNALKRFLHTFGIDRWAVPDDLDECVALYRSMLAGRRYLIVLDNVDTATQVAPFLPATADAAVIVTSRRMLADLNDSIRIPLGVLSENESVALLAARLGRRAIGQPGVTLRTVRLCGCLPLALHAVAARLVARPQWTMEQLAQRIADEGSRLGELSLGRLDVGARARSSHHQLAASHDLVDRLAARALPILAVECPQEFRLDGAVKALSGEADPERVVERLVDVRLLDSPAPGRYWMHEITRLCARQMSADQLPVL